MLCCILPVAEAGKADLEHGKCLDGCPDRHPVIWMSRLRTRKIIVQMSRNECPEMSVQIIFLKEMS